MLLMEWMGRDERAAYQFVNTKIPRKKGKWGHIYQKGITFLTLLQEELFLLAQRMCDTFLEWLVRKDDSVL